MGLSEEYAPKSCPDFKDCKVRTTMHHFNTLCNTKGFMRCVTFCMKRKMMKTPTEWMITLAVNDANASSIEQGVPVK